MVVPDISRASLLGARRVTLPVSYTHSYWPSPRVRSGAHRSNCQSPRSCICRGIFDHLKFIRVDSAKPELGVTVDIFAIVAQDAFALGVNT